MSRITMEMQIDMTDKDWELINKALLYMMLDVSKINSELSEECRLLQGRWMRLRYGDNQE